LIILNGKRKIKNDLKVLRILKYAILLLIKRMSLSKLFCKNIDEKDKKEYIFVIQQLILREIHRGTIYLKRINLQSYFEDATLNFVRFNTNYHSYIVDGEIRIGIGEIRVDEEWIKKQIDYFKFPIRKHSHLMRDDTEELLTIWSYFNGGEKFVNLFLENNIEKLFEELYRTHEDKYKNRKEFLFLFYGLEKYMSRNIVNEFLNEGCYYKLNVPAYKYNDMIEMFPNIRREHILNAMKYYIQKFEIIVKNSPQPTNPMWLYCLDNLRCVKDEEDTFKIVDSIHTYFDLNSITEYNTKTSQVIKMMMVTKPSGHFLFIPIFNNNGSNVFILKDSKFKVIISPDKGQLKDVKSQEYVLDILCPKPIDYTVLEFQNDNVFF